ncbi:hypothetical protein Ddc_06494 [Ditylenchus destructor]|nr:hypothetical protein Ddc_06494 [Ditylenchus destructor]
MPSLLYLFVNILASFSRNELGVVSEVNRPLRQIVQHNFSSKPYRVLSDALLKIERMQRIVVSLQRTVENEFNGEDEPNGELPPMSFNPNTTQWQHGEMFVNVNAMRRHFAPFLRVQLVVFFCRQFTYTANDLTALASISHVWSGRYLSLAANLETEDNLRRIVLTSVRCILSNGLIYSARSLDLYGATPFVSLHDYPKIYATDVILLKVYRYGIPFNTEILLDLIQHKAQFPKSNTVFVVDNMSFSTELSQIIDAIRQNFSSASKPCSFKLITIDNLESKEFRIQNEKTKEVLQLKSITNDAALEYCSDIDEDYAKCVMVERYSI